MIFTKSGTSLADFNAMREQIDGGKGATVARDVVDWQLYTTFLTADQAKNISQAFEGIIASIEVAVPLENAWVDLDQEPFVECEVEADMRQTAKQADGAVETSLPAVTASSVTAANTATTYVLYELEDAFHHQRLLSAPPGTPIDTNRFLLPPYRFESYAGEGSTIYVVDTGCNLDSPELQPSPWRSVRSKVVFYEHHLGQIYPYNTPSQRTIWLPKDIRDNAPNGGHGTKVAIMAAGLTLGVAHRANLVCVKQQEYVRATLVDGRPALKMLPARLGAAIEALTWILQDVRDQRTITGNPRSKVVVNLSFGGPNLQHLPPLQAARAAYGYQKFRQLIEQMWAEDIVVVAAGGNAEPQRRHYLHDYIPTAWGSADNAMITVGSVDADGKYSRKNVREQGPGLGGSMTVYAQGWDVACLRSPVTGFVMQDSGTSFAAPIVVRCSRKTNVFTTNFLL